MLGSPMDLGVALSIVEVSPRQDYALGVGAGSGSLLLVGLSSPFVRETQLAALATERILISPTGAAAALYDGDRRVLRLVTGLPDQPSEAGEIDLSSLPALITAMAVSDRGIALVAVAEGATGALFAVAPEASPHFVSLLGDAAAIRFLEDTSDALIADRSRNEIILVRDVTGAAERILVAGERDGISRPVAVAASGDRRRIFAANAGGNTVAILNVEGGAPVLAPCPCDVSGLARLRGDSVFLLTGASQNPLFLIDAGTAEPQVLFVPGDPDSAPPGVAAPPRSPRQRAGQ